MPDFPEASSTQKDKRSFGKATQNLCAESQKAELQPEKKTQSNNDEEDIMSAVSSWTTVTQNFIQAKSLFTHVLSNIVGYLDSKENEKQNSMA